MRGRLLRVRHHGRDTAGAVQALHSPCASRDALSLGLEHTVDILIDLRNIPTRTADVAIANRPTFLVWNLPIGSHTHALWS